jgi:hypothetical protein
MSDQKKTLSARQAAQLVLAKAHQLLAKSEPLKKYETENDPKSGIKYGKIEKDQTPTERDYKEYEVKPGNHKDSSGPRVAKQVSPSKNPKEEAEGNNKPDGMEPEYQFKDKVSKELAKEKASHMVKAESGMHTVVYKGLEKSENPDQEADAELGEKVEHDVEEHMMENKDAEEKEGHEIMKKPGDKMEGETESAVIPRLIGSAKLSKFMEYRHAKKKVQMAHEAAGAQASAAPQAGSTQAGQPDPTRPKTQPTKGDVNKV